MSAAAQGSVEAAALLAEGRRLFDAGMAADALDLLRRANALAPENETSAEWLAQAQLSQGALDDVEATLSQALARSPSSPKLIVLQAETALKRGSLGTAEAFLDAAIDAGNTATELLAERGRVHLFAGEYGAAVDCLRRGLALDPHSLAMQSSLIFAASFEPSMTTERLKRLQARWTAPPRPPHPTLVRDGGDGRRLRVGYVSNGFSRHAAAQVFSAVLLHHDATAVETYCYSSNRRRDWASVRLRLAVKEWRSIAGLDDGRAADLIRGDRIDILVDLDGHFAGNRLGVFGLRAAPVQVSAWGYVPGPGVPGIDYLITDRLIAPDTESRFFPERLVHLPCAQPFDAAFLTSSAPPLDAEEPQTRPIRFGCFNRLDKLNDDVLTLWAEILVACPGATLTLKDAFFAEARPRDRVQAVVARRGVDPARILFEGRAPHPEYLAAFDRIDVALDPFPVNGGVTSLDGLSRGVPVITLCGVQPSGRIGVSILTYLGLERCIARSREEYVRLSVALGRDRAALLRLRRDVLAARVRFAPEAVRGYAREVEAAYREMWQSRPRG